MNENEEVVVPTDAELDAAWNDDEVEVADDGEQEQPTADQPEEEKPVEEEAAETKEQEEKQAETDQPLTFTLKHLDEVKTVDKDEIVKLAQQGMDYERVKTERDQLRTYRTEADPALAFVKTFAEKNGMSIPDYMDYCRKQALLDSGINEQTATAQIALEKQKAALKADDDARKSEEAQKQKAAEIERQKADAKAKDMSRFLEKFPTVKPTDIPSEVWVNVAKGDSLVVAYTEHRNKQLETELAAERQNKANAQKTTGSLATNGAGKQDDIDKWWNDD